MEDNYFYYVNYSKLLKNKINNLAMYSPYTKKKKRNEKKNCPKL